MRSKLHQINHIYDIKLDQQKKVKNKKQKKGSTVYKSKFLALQTFLPVPNLPSPIYLFVMQFIRRATLVLYKNDVIIWIYRIFAAVFGVVVC